MQTLPGRIVRIYDGAMPAPQVEDQAANDADIVVHLYYFLLPQQRVRQSRKGGDSALVCAFGPFPSPLEARFINTSALALGLMEFGQTQ